MGWSSARDLTIITLCGKAKRDGRQRENLLNIYYNITITLCGMTKRDGRQQET